MGIFDSMLGYGIDGVGDYQIHGVKEKKQKEEKRAAQIYAFYFVDQGNPALGPAQLS